MAGETPTGPDTAQSSDPPTQPLRSQPETAGVETAPDTAGVETFAPLPSDGSLATQTEVLWYMEQAALLISTAKWALLGAIIGILAGLGVRLFLLTLGWSSVAASRIRLGPFRFYDLLPIIFPLCVLLTRGLARIKSEEETEGTDAVITAIHVRSGRINLPTVPQRLLATLLTLAFGGSAGKEGPGAQIGGAIASGVASIMRLSNEDRRRLVICGVSAGFAAVFGTPISGALFGVEVLYLGRLEYPVLFPCIVAGILAQLVCGTRAPVPPESARALLGAMSRPVLIGLALGFGLFFGLVAFLFIETMRTIDRMLTNLADRPFFVAVVGGVALALLYHLFSSRYAGLGTATIEQELGGAAKILLVGFLVKILATSITLKTGGVGGIVTPLFFIGAASGGALATVLHLPEATFARFGFIAVVAAGANTPIAGAVMGMELLGGQMGVYAALCACTAYLLVGHRSVFASQRLSYSKSAGLLPPLDIPIGEITRADLKVREGTLAARIQQMRLRRPRRKQRSR